MAAINNFSLVGIGSSVKLGKGGIVLGQNSGILTVNSGSGAANVALESYVINSISALNLANTYQAKSAVLTSYAAGPTPTSFFLSLADDTDAAASRSTLGLVIGTDVQAWDADLDAIAALSADGLLRKTAGTWGMDSTVYLTAADISGKADKSYVDSTFLKLDGTSAMTGALNMGTHKITNVVDPTSAQDAATMNYVDTQIAAVSSGSTITKKLAYDLSAATSGDITASLPIGATVTKVVIKVLTATTTGTSPAILITQDTNNVDDGTGSDIASTGTYIMETYYTVSAADMVSFTTSGTPTDGTGVIYVEYVI